MSKPITRIFNIETGETVEREMTDAEHTIYLADQADSQRRIDERASAESAKKVAAEKLAALGLTADDLQALGL
jgi:HD superfamily phosphohydrolase YqeK